jgi:predicted AAA+ superfamily ATPase
MLQGETIKEIVKLQQENLRNQETGVRRDLLDKVDMSVPHAIIISGIRRCGKSTLLRQMIKEKGDCSYFNFEDSRADGFDLGDFRKLDSAFAEISPGTDCYYFDEVQNVRDWERFVRGSLDAGKRFVITGSNASLFSRELGTRLTGRHLDYELFPFSYAETLRLKEQSPSVATFREYAERGGFPEYVKLGTSDILQQLFKDIIARDIVVRHGLRNAAIVEKLALYLLSNSGTEFSYTRLGKIFRTGSVHSIIDYISYYEDSYLLFTVPMFSYSYAQQQINNKKVYAIDPGMIRTNTVSFTADDGKLLENMVFLQLRRDRKPGSIYYYKGNRECDFVIAEKGKVTQAIQVCYRLAEDNLERELDGVDEAMRAFELDKGLIITMDQEDRFENVDVIPAWKWMTGQARVVR